MELDGELLTMCVIADEGSDSSSSAIAGAQTILQRIAKYRAEKPAIYPAE